MKEKTEFEDLEISEAKREYLIMLQEPISRLSTASSVLKICCYYCYWNCSIKL